MTRLTITGTPARCVSRKSRKRNASPETSSSVSFASTFRAFGPAMERPTRSMPSGRIDTEPSVRQMPLEPAHVIDLRLARSPHEEAVLARLGDGEVADQLALLVQHRGQHDAAGLRHAVGHQARQERLGAGAGDRVFGEIGDLGDADAVRAPPSPRASRARNRWSGGRRRRPSARRPSARTRAASRAPS